MTVINMRVPWLEFYPGSVVDNANAIFSAYRRNTQDLLLAPFMGNNKDGVWRRRLDYATARAILEESIETTCPSAAGPFGAYTQGVLQTDLPMAARPPGDALTCG